MGPLVASAASEGYTHTEGKHAPYHGYFYHLLEEPRACRPRRRHATTSSTATCLGGFAVVAWPADYGNSGIMTFITNHDGIVYQKDLGDDTANLAAKITTFDPDSKRTPAEPPPAASSTTQPAN